MDNLHVRQNLAIYRHVSISQQVERVSYKQNTRSVPILSFGLIRNFSNYFFNFEKLFRKPPEESCKSSEGICNFVNVPNFLFKFFKFPFEVTSGCKTVGQKRRIKSKNFGFAHYLQKLFCTCWAKYELRNQV